MDSGKQAAYRTAPAMTPLIPHWLVESGLSANQIAVLVKLWRHRGKLPPFEAWPSRAEILRCVPMNKDTLSGVIKALEVAGLLRRKTTWRGGHKAIVFELIVPTETIVRNGGTIIPGQSSETRGGRSSETEGVPSSESEDGQSSETEGRGSYTGKIERLKIEKGVRAAPLSSWPDLLSVEQLEEISAATGKPTSFILQKWPEFRDRKLRYGDKWNGGQGLAGFRDFMRQTRQPSEFANLF